MPTPTQAPMLISMPMRALSWCVCAFVKTLLVLIAISPMKTNATTRPALMLTITIAIVVVPTSEKTKPCYNIVSI